MTRLTCLVVLCALSGCGPKSMSARMSKSERLANDADELLAKAEKAVSDGDGKAAETFVADAKRIIAEPDAQLYPEYEMLLSRLKEDEAKAADVKTARAHLDLAGEVAKRTAKIDEQSARLKKALKAMDAASFDKAAIDEVGNAANDLLDAVKDGDDLEAKDKSYAELVKKQRDAYEAMKVPVALAKVRLDYMQGPAATRDAAAAKMKAAKSAKSPDDKKAALTAALKLYDQCEDDSRKLLRAAPAISRLAIMAGGIKTTPEALDTACSKEWQDVDKALKKLAKGKKKQGRRRPAQSLESRHATMGGFALE